MNKYLQLIRPPALLTAPADVVAGYFILMPFFEDADVPTLILLILTSLFLYAGGVIFNDCCDFVSGKDSLTLRPIPQGRVTLKTATILATTLLLAGLFCSFFLGLTTAVFAVFIICAVLLYDSYLKSFAGAGSLNMALCRVLNMLMGMSVVKGFANKLLHGDLFFPLILGVFVFFITLISTTETKKEKGSVLLISIGGMLLVLTAEIILGIVVVSSENLFGGIVSVGLFLFVFSVVVWNLHRAIMSLKESDVKRAVWWGVQGIALTNAGFLLVVNQTVPGVIIALLVIPSWWLGKRFAH